MCTFAVYNSLQIVTNWILYSRTLADRENNPLYSMLLISTTFTVPGMSHIDYIRTN